MREKELRLALVCTGGISLAVYMHGITKEVWKLLRASAARTGGGAAAGDTEPVYAALLDALAPALDLRVVVDILAGASAGGINAILLADAVAGGHDMAPLTDLWLDGADVDRLLDAGGAAGRWSKWWATPLVWAARRRGDLAEAAVDRAARGEVRAKLSRFMRSRWFRPPFSGPGFTAMLYDAIAAMRAGPAGAPLIPPGLPLDLFVTVTDYHGRPETLALNSPDAVVETEHRLVIGFRADGDRAPRALGDAAELAFAARATASFPGAFPPAQVGEIDAVVAARGAAWPGRAAFLARVFPRRAAAGQRFEDAALIDGSVLDNRPFAPAIEALGRRPAHRAVDRRFVYIDPKPPRGRGGRGRGPPGFFATVLRALADIPREQPIRDNLEALAAMSARVARLRTVVEAMTPQVDAAVESAIGVRFFLLPLTPTRLGAWRARAQAAAARGAGFAYAAYGALKLAQVGDTVAGRIAALAGDPAAAAAVAAFVDRQRLAVAGAARGGYSAYVDFLRRLDLDFRVRRLRFLLRRLNRLAERQGDAERATSDSLKAALYDLLAPYLARGRDGFFAGIDLTRAAADPRAAIAAYAAALDLKTLDAATDARLVELFSGAIASPLRRALLRAWLGFPFYDIAMLPLLQGDALDEFDAIKVDRIAPDDAHGLRRDLGTLKGTRFNSFGAFFSRAYRENDYLWGRLHGADRLIDIVVSTVAPGTVDGPAVAALKRRAFAAILAAERARLTAIPDLLAALDAELDA